MSADDLAARILRWCCRRLDERSRPWGDAMLAELDQVGGRAERFRWALGGVMVMLRMLINSWLDGTRTFAEGEVLSGGATPPRRRWPPILFAVLAIAVFIIPEVRQALGVVSASFATFRLISGSPGNRFSAISEPQLERIASKGRSTRNAQLFALAAINTSDIAHKREWADAAIGIDPELTWIDYVVASREGEYARDVTLAPQQRSEYLADARRRAAAVAQWDPGNAIPYLLEAGLAVKDRDIFSKYARHHEESLLNSEPEWLEAMGKAFAAPRYDSYVDRRFALSRAAPQAFGSAAPWATLLGLAGHPIPNLMQLRAYADYLMASDARVRWTYGESSLTDPARAPADLRPDFGDPARIPRYWQVALMGERMQLSSTVIEKLIGVALDVEAYRPLMIALQKSGQKQQADAIAYRLRQIDRTAMTFQNMGRQSEQRAFAWLAALTSIASLAALLSAGALLIASLYFFARRLRRRNPSMSLLDRRMRSLLYAAPAWLLGSCVAILVCYWPFARAYDAFMSSKRPPDLESLYTIFGGFGSLPGALLFSSSGRGGMVTWSILTAALSLVLVWRLVRMVRPAAIAK